MEPIGTNVFFLAPWARSVSGRLPPGGGRFRRRCLQLRRAACDQPLRGGLRYRNPSAGGVAGGRTKLSAADRSNVSAPAGGRSARSATGSTGHRFRPQQLRQGRCASRTICRTRFGYTLQLPRTPPKDPIANFLFERKQGHCEYFASSMAVMLRTLGIPSRVVNGFRSDEFNDLTGNYVVRAKDAHAWVEAYFPGYGWQTFDPTPAGSAWHSARMGPRRASTSTPWPRSGATGSSATTPRTSTFWVRLRSAERAACGRALASGLATTTKPC